MGRRTLTLKVSNLALTSICERSAQVSRLALLSWQFEFPYQPQNARALDGRPRNGWAP